jgi:Xaa-Pro aminopeptidase
VPAATVIAADELHERVDRIASEVVARGLDGLLVWGRGGNTLERHGEVLWLTNFYNASLAVTDSDRWAGQASCAVLVTAAGDTVLVTNVPHGEWAHQPVVCDQWTDDPFIERSAAQALRRHGLERGRIGLAGRDALALDRWERLTALLPEVRWTPVDGVVRALAEVKSEAELDIVRAGGVIADGQMQATLAAMRPDGSELAALAAGGMACTLGGGVGYGTFLACGARESRLSPASLTAGIDRVLEAGQLWRVDLIGAFKGYLYDFARSTVIGHPDALQEEVLEAPIAVVEAVIAAIEPGRPVADAFRAGQRTLERVAPWAVAPGAHDFPHFGHSLGLGWGGWWLTERETRPFATNMVFAVEAVIAHPSVGAPMFEQNLIVGEDRVELLTRCPARPWQLAP